MNRVNIRQDLAAQVTNLAHVVESDLEEFVNQAIQERLIRITDQILAHEIQAFEELHGQLVPEYLGKYVAVHHGAVVDSDENFEDLFLRTQTKWADTPILIRPVTSKITPEWRGPSINWQKSVT